MNDSTPISENSLSEFLFMSKRSFVLKTDSNKDQCSGIDASQMHSSIMNFKVARYSSIQIG